MTDSADMHVKQLALNVHTEATISLDALTKFPCKNQRDNESTGQHEISE